MSELLIYCPYCQERNFTICGLSQHWCFAKAQKILGSAKNILLTKEECEAAVAAARAKYGAENTPKPE